MHVILALHNVNTMSYIYIYTAQICIFTVNEAELTCK